MTGQNVSCIYKSGDTKNWYRCAFRYIPRIYCDIAYTGSAVMLVIQMARYGCRR